MARSPEATPVLNAAAHWRDRCLLDEGSVFTDQPIWTASAVQGLITHYVENLDEGEGDFFQKFEKQMADAPPQSVRLAAELLWVMYLIVSSRAASGATKRLQIRKVFAWSGENIPEDHWALGEVLDTGVAHPGTAYNTHRWRELVFFIRMLERWMGLPRAEREELLASPWVFAEWVRQVEGAARRQLPHILCYLLFPDSFEAITGRRHKEEIAEAFHELIDTDRELDYTDVTALDRAVLQVREALSAEYGEELHFYKTKAVAERWREDKTVPDGDGAAPDQPQTESEAWLRKELKTDRVWLLAAGEGGRLWTDFEREGIAAIGWDYLGDLSAFSSREEIQAEIASVSGKENPTNDSLACWEFGHVMAAGDVILAKRGASTLLAHGRVTGDYVYEEDRAEYQHTRTVDWTPVEGWEIPEDRRVANKTLTDFTKYPNWVRKAFGWIGAAPDETTTDGDASGPYTLQHAMEGLFMPEQNVQHILDTLAQMKNAILQGPPGVGKTFVARRLAWALIGRKAPENVEFVQFHQSYAYEDFIQGIRPTRTGGFELRNGVFYRFCERARARPREPFVFIIDEINRGNLSRIFGELMMLIEADKRGANHAVALTYAHDGERFSVPDNVHILGMMNTADRSLAMVDYALRRRFAFFSLKPAYGSEAFIEHLADAGVDEGVVRLIDERFRALNKEISEDTQNLGPGFEIGHSYFVPSEIGSSFDIDWYRSIVRTQILPLLREYWFDNPALADRHAERLGVS